MIRNLSRPLSVSALCALLFVASGCGRSSDAQKVETKKGSASGDATAGKPCSSDNCPKVTFDVQAQGAEGNVMVGYLNQPVTWSFAAIAADGSIRETGVYLTSLPSGAKSGKTFDTVASVEWTPSEKGKSSKSIQVKVIDLSRCEAQGVSASKCRSPESAPEEYIQVEEYGWRVDNAPVGAAPGEDGAQVVRVSDVSCGGLQPTSNGQVLGGAVQAGIPILTGILTGNLGGIVQVLPNVIGTFSQGDKKPTQC